MSVSLPSAAAGSASASAHSSALSLQSLAGGGGGGGGAPPRGGLGGLASTDSQGGFEDTPRPPTELRAARAGNLERMAAAARVILECLGEDVSREGLVKTPMRMSKALLAMTSGYELTPADVVNDALFESASEGMVCVRDIEVHSMCEHHMLPFFGRIHIAYLPAGRVLGLSKLARLADVYARRLQIQERLTEQVASAVNEACGARGVAVMVDCQHMCMALRGVAKSGASTVTTCYLGAFRDSAELRAEFLSRTK